MQRGGSVIGLDQDLDAVKTANEILQDYIKMNACEIIQSNFRNIETALSMSQLFGSRTPPFVDGVLMDLGVSSHQINEPSRGFAFGSDGPLDMRMSNGKCSHKTKRVRIYSFITLSIFFYSSNNCIIAHCRQDFERVELK